MFLLSVVSIVTGYKNSATNSNEIIIGKTVRQNYVIYFSIVIQIILFLYNLNLSNFVTDGLSIVLFIALFLAFDDII